MKPYVALVLIVLGAVGPATSHGAEIRLGVIGDSLSDPYANYPFPFNPATGLPFWGAAGDRNWAEQLNTKYPGLVRDNQAKAGATSADVLSQGQHTKVATRITNGQVNGAVVAVGANDVLGYIATNLGGDPSAMTSGVANNVNTVLTTLRATGKVGIAVANIPDMAVSPVMQAALGGIPGALPLVSGVIAATNQQLATVASAHGAAVLDLYGLSHFTDAPLAMGGTTIAPQDLFAPDFFHPGTELQGLLGNMVLEAFGADVGKLLTDQEILTLANDAPAPGATHLDVRGFVAGQVSPVPEPSTTLLWAALGAGGFLVHRRRSRSSGT